MASILGMNQAQPGDQNDLECTQSQVTTISLTGVESTTSSVGSCRSSQSKKVGVRQEWGNSGWGVEYAVQPTGQYKQHHLSEVSLLLVFKPLIHLQVYLSTSSVLVLSH